jgi:hypothetical protein
MKLLKISSTMKNSIYIAFTSVLMTACTDELIIPLMMPQYTFPTSASQSATTVFGHPKDDVFIAATTALLHNGYKITRSDPIAGIITTAQQDLPITYTQADCGLLKMNPLPDNKTTTKTVMTVTIISHKLTVQAEIEAVYQPTNITLTCISRGVLEQDMVQKIKAEIR